MPTPLNFIDGPMPEDRMPEDRPDADDIAWEDPNPAGIDPEVEDLVRSILEEEALVAGHLDFDPTTDPF